MIVNKVELVNRVAKETGITKKDTASMLDSVFEILSNAIIDGEEIAIPRFGKFKTVMRSERQGVDPRNTNERITIPAKRIVKFSPASALKKEVANG